MRRRRSKKQSNALICEELEPRILLSADLVGVAVEPASNDVEQQVNGTELQTIEAALQSAALNQTDESKLSTRELVIIDPATPDYQPLVDDLISRNGDGRNFEIVLLDSADNGIDQLSETLAQYRELDAIHLISHGSEGEIQLGDAILNLEELQQSAEQIGAWGQALNTGGDWLFYGCDIASTATGERFIEQFAALTGADVAASNDVTGHETLGGDWDLEVAEGSIETDVAVGIDGQQAWQNRLDITTGLLGHWTLDSDATDSSGSSHDGTLTNGASIDNPGSSNPIGDGNLNLDGFNDFVQLNTHVSSFSGLSEGTIAAWINTSDTGLQAIFSISDNADFDSSVVLGMDNGRIFFDVGNNGFYSLSVETNAAYADGTWHHVAVTVDGSGNSVYIDGVQVSLAGLFYRNGNSSTTSFFSSVTSLDSMAIGNLRDAGGYTGSFNGLQDDVRVYDRALSAADIAELLSNTAPTFDVAGPPSFTPHTITSSADNAASVTTVDMDGDGDLDVVSASQNDNKIAWYENDGSQNFTAHTITTSAITAFSVTTADVDGDGDIDVLSASIGDDKIAWYENDGNENFTAHTITLSADIAASVAAADVDGDGDMDVLSASVGDDTVAWYENDGNENFTIRTITSSAVGASFVATVDLDEDGDLDVLSTSAYDNRVAWYENDGNENFTTRTVTTSAEEARQVKAVDVDGDGDLDLVSASLSADKLAWYENDGFENFTLHTITAAAGSVAAVAVADIDDDGDVDLISASTTDDNLVWFENDGSENFTANTIAGTTGTTFSVAVADMDGDGDVDVLATDTVADSVTWYENVGSVTSLDGTPTFVEDGAAVVLDADVDVSDAELDALNSGLGDYDGASVTLVRNGAANSDDVFGFNDGNGITLSGGNLIKSSQIIASFDTTTTAGELVITFTNANGQTPTSADVDNILRQITYSNSNDTPPASVQIDWTFDDGNTGSQGSGGALQAVGSTTVTITAVNDDPSNAGSLPTDIAVDEDVSSNVDLSAVDFADIDAGAGTLTVTLTTSTGGNLSAAAGTGITIGGSSTARTLTGTLSDLNNYFNTASNITYLHGTPGTEGDNADTINVTINDNGNTGTGGGTNIDLGTVNVDITPDNEAPTITNLGGDNLAYSEGDGAQVIDQGTASVVADVDSSDFDTGTLTVSFQAGSDNAEDVLAIRDQGAGASNITVSGSAVSYGGTQIGTFTGGSGGTDLVITLDADADATAVTALVRNITYENTDIDNPTTGARTVRFVLTDGDGATSVDYNTTVTVSTVNDDPTITDLGGDALVYSEGDGAQVIDQGAASAVADVDSSDFDTGTLTVSFQSGSDNAEDVLAIRDQGAGPSNITVSGSTVSYGGTQIGTFTGGSGGTNLVITLDADADAIAVGTLIRNITYENTDTDDPTTGARTVRFVLTDGDGGTSIDYDTTVTVSGVNDAPTDLILSVSTELSDEQVNSNETGDQSRPQIAVLNSGSYVIVWNDNSGLDGDGSGVFAQLYDANGNTLVSEFQVNTTASNPQNLHSVIALQDGGFAVGMQTDRGGGVYYSTICTFDASGNPTSGEIDVDVYGYRTQLTQLQDGNLFVTYVDTSGTDDISFTVITPSGSTVVGETQIASITSWAPNPYVTTLDSGDVAVTWRDGATNQAMTRVYQADGTPLGAAVAYGGTNVQDSFNNSVSVSATTSGFVTAYEDGGDIYIQHWNNDGSLSGSPVVVANDADVQGAPSVESLSDGTLLVVWQSANQDGSGLGAYAQHLSVTGDLYGSAQLINTTTSGDQGLPRIAELNNGDIIATWQSDNLDTDGKAVVQKVLSFSPFVAEDASNGTVVASVTDVIDPDAGDSHTFSLVDDAGGAFDINPTTGVITVANSNLIDYESATSMDVTVRATDGGSLSHDEVVTIQIVNVNEDPTNAGSLPSDIAVTEDVSSEIDLSALDFADVDAGAGTLTVTLTTSTGGNLSAAAGTGITVGGTSTARTLTGTLTDLNNYFNTASNITYLHGTANTDGNDADTINVTINDNGNTGSGGGTDIDLGTVNVDITAVNDDPSNAGSLPSDIAVTEDVSSNVDLSAVDFADVDAASGTLTVTLTTSTGGNLSADAGTGITIGGTPTALTLTGTLTDLNNYFNTTSNITYLHGTANTNGNDADTINVTINDNGNTGTGGGIDVDLGTANVDIGVVNDTPTLAATAANDTLTENSDTTSGAVFATVTIDPIEAGDDIASAQLTLGGGIENSDILTINGTAISGLGSNSSGAITGGHSYSYTQATGVVTITFAGGTNAAAAELVLESITYGIDPAADNPSTTARTVTLNTVTDNGGGSDTSSDISETATISVSAVNDDPTNSGSLPSDIAVTEDVSSNVDLSAIDLSDVDIGAGTLTVTLTTGTGGDLSAAAGAGITLGGTPTALTLTGTLTDLNNYFNTTSNITYLHGTANTAGDNADTINVTINDNGNTGTGGGTDINLGTVNVDITAVNDGPVVVDLDGDIHNFTEGDGVVLIEQGGDAVVSDSDSSDYAGGSLTVEVDSGLQSAEDRFSIFNQGTDTGEIGLSGGNVTYSGTLIGTVTGGTGIDPLTVTFNSNATSAAVTALVRNITYENSNLENPTDGTRSVTIDISDGDGGTSLTQNLTLNVSSVNDAPVVDLNGADGAGADFAATFTEDGGAVNVVDTDATISDVDNTTYQNLSINLVGFPDGASEQLTIAGYAFTYGVSDNVIRTVGSTDFEIDFDGTGINVMRDGGGGMPEADLQTLLRGITYENTSQDPTAGDRTINIFAQDSSLLSGPIATSTITVNPQNDAPTATDNANSVSENGFVSGNVITDDSGSGVDSDPEGDGLQVTQVEGGAYTPGLPITLASGAQVTFQANGSYTYNTNGQFEGLGAGDSVDDNFTYQIGDGNGGSDTATVTITINGSNNTPSITSADLTLDEGQTVTLGDANFAVTDADDTDFTYTVSGISGGYFQLSTNPGVSITSFTSANLTGGLVQFVDDGNEVAPAFSVTVNDGDIDSNTLAATINFTLVSDSTPIANNDSITVAEGGTVTTLDGGFSTVLNNDTGLVDAPVTVSLVTDVTNGSLTLNGDGTFSYTHDGTENFTDSFTYRVTDNDGQTADATVTINITPVSDATPVANADSITVAEGGTTTTLVGGSSTVLNNDTGLGDTPVTVSLVTDVVNGTLTLNGDGTFSYTHDGTENFTDSFTYRVTDNDGQTADATVTINVTPVSDETPVANADSITVAEGATATTLVGGSSTVLNNDTGLGDTPVIVSLITDVTNGSLTLNGDGTFSYTHDGSENFTDSFTYRITDNDGETADATVTINITPVSDATPVANADSITVAEGATATTLVGGSSTVLNNDTGLGDTPVTVSLVTDVTNGTLILNTDGTFSYTHDG
ncbi:MAG: FG-GAP-like repeat-containing protein, partial [Candidatus Thiodiazotropha endolucinida]